MKRTAEAKLNTISFGSGLALRSDLHLARKTWHISMGLMTVLIFLLSGMSTHSAVLILGRFLGFNLLVETARLRIPAFNQQVLRLMGPVMRSSEANRVS